LMNYPVMDALVGLLATDSLNVSQFTQKVKELFSLYPQENTYAMYVLVDSHDTERILTRMSNDLNKTRLAYLFQFAYPGAPAIYYGDEIGLVGGKDPGCRGAFIWDEASWNTQLRNFLKQLVLLRKQHQSLRRGEFLWLEGNSPPGCIVFLRKTNDDCVLVIINASGADVKASLDIEKTAWNEGKEAKDLLNPSWQYRVENRSIEIDLPAWSGKWLA
jgi:cyclomaltodextrinase